MSLSAGNPWAWWTAAACLDTATELWFPEGWESTIRDEARAICAGCPVAHECLDYAVANRIEDGIWGGRTARERRLLRRQLKQAA